MAFVLWMSWWSAGATPPGGVTSQEAEKFIASLLDAMDRGQALVPFVEPQALARLQGQHPDLKVNRYGIGQWKIESLKAQRVAVKLSHNDQGAPDWIRVVTFELVRVGDRLYAVPGSVSASQYVDPWVANTYLPNGRKLVFYLLADEDADLLKSSPRFVCSQLNGDADFIADSAPAMVVQSITGFLASDYAKVAAMPLPKPARDELRKLKAWLDAARLPVVGYQIDR